MVLLTLSGQILRRPLVKNSHRTLSENAWTIFSVYQRLLWQTWLFTPPALNGSTDSMASSLWLLDRAHHGLTWQRQQFVFSSFSLLSWLKRCDRTPPLQPVPAALSSGPAPWRGTRKFLWVVKTPLELAFGRPPRVLVPLETALPSQLCEPGMGDNKDQNLKMLAMKAYLEARQARDLRQDLARSLRPTDGPYSPGGRVFYWHQDPSTIKAGEWIRATVVSQQGPMVCLDTGSTVLRVNQSLIRRDQDAWHDVLVPLDTPVVSYYIHSAMCSMGVKCHFLELFSHSARLSEACLSMPDLLVAAPLDLTQPDTTQERVWEVLTVVAPRVVAIVPRQRPWRKKPPGESKWQVTQKEESRG